MPAENEVLNTYYEKFIKLEHSSFSTVYSYSYDPEIILPTAQIQYASTLTASAVAGTIQVIVSSTNGIKVGDHISIGDNTYFRYPSSVEVASISGNTIYLTQRIVTLIPTNTAVVTTRSLNGVFSKGEFILSIPELTGGVVTVSGYAEPVRLDSNTGPIYPITCDGLTDTFALPTYSFAAGDRVTLRKDTSDGSVEVTSFNYDTALSGGDFNNLLVAGITVDGDEFATVTNSYAPEEVVPGYVSDAVAIKVTTKVTESETHSFMIFKDMLNRNHYKRLSNFTELDGDVTINSTVIKVKNATLLDDPNIAQNIPGVIEISGERIEYFIKIGNDLSQLRRGTLGTSIPTLHPDKSVVTNTGVSQTIPYSDTTELLTIIGDGEQDTISLGVDGLTNDAIDVFVSGMRLKKAAFTKFAQFDLTPVSPDGDVVYSSEFEIIGDQLILSTVPPKDSEILVIKKRGLLWDLDSSTRFSTFVNAS